MKIQRLRITFSRAEEMKYITHLDMMRFWERALRRAALPVAYSEGFSPHPQIAMAAPLAVGTTSDGELMDVFMSEAIPPRRVIADLAAQLPAGIAVRTVEEVGLTLPALQADVRFAEYEVDVAGAGQPVDEAGTHVDDPGSTLQSPNSPRTATDAVAHFLAQTTIPWEHKREDEVRTYDIRAQVETIEVLREEGDDVRMRMVLKNDNTGSGRPEQIVGALGLGAPSRIHRTRLVLANTSPSRDAWRKAGRFAG
jgi:radical SAM-linked protein